MMPNYAPRGLSSITADAGVKPERHGPPLAGAPALHAQAGRDAGATLRVQFATRGQQLP